LWSEDKSYTLRLTEVIWAFMMDAEAPPKLWQKSLSFCTGTLEVPPKKVLSSRRRGL